MMKYEDEVVVGTFMLRQVYMCLFIYLSTSFIPEWLSNLSSDEFHKLFDMC